MTTEVMMMKAMISQSAAEIAPGVGTVHEVESAQPIPTSHNTSAGMPTSQKVRQRDSRPESTAEMNLIARKKNFLYRLDRIRKRKT